MNLKTGVAFVGSLIGLGGAAGVYFGIGANWVALGVIVGVGVIGYIVGAVAAAPTSRSTEFGEFMRGLLVGFNAGANGFIAFVIVNMIGGLGAGLGVGIALGLVNYLCVFGPVSQSQVFQGFAGWLTLLMPMSWPIAALGLAFLLLSVLLTLVTFAQVGYLRVRSLKVDWKTGTVFLKGGLIANLNYLDTAFNMGNFSFVDEKSSNWHIEHEAGHTLNLTAFGSVFHLMGALDENVIRRGSNAFSERLAESNSSGTSGSNIPMWT